MMALTNSRPFDIPTSASDNEILLNNTSPVFQASALGYSNKLDSITATAADVFPNMTPTSDYSGSGKVKKDVKKEKDVSSLEISKMIPVTGERPMPTDRSSPLDDEVLYKVFVILWEKDTEQQGMTVKQLCDHLLVKDPEMSTLSTKLSNLISAKLNAYVKKLEKGEKTLTYALSREWSDSSPRRMLYIYRGILSADYKDHAHAAVVQLKQQQQMNAIKNGEGLNGDNLDDEATAFNKKMGIQNNLAFSLANNFDIPYASSPVSANLTPRSSKSNLASPQVAVNQANIQAMRANNLNQKRAMEDVLSSKDEKSNNKRAKAMNVESKNKIAETPAPAPYITAAAAAPRSSKFSSKENIKTITESSMGVLSAIHKVISTQTPIEPCITAQTLRVPDSASDDNESPSVFSSWMKHVREGFLTQDIESPESLTLDELDGIFI